MSMNIQLTSHSMSSPAPSNTTAEAQCNTDIAHEIWGLVILQPLLDRKDLKNIRLVCTAFRDFATPRLYKQVSFSLIRENVSSLRNIGKSPSLFSLVETIDLDNSIFMPVPTIHTYCELATSHFEKYLGPQAKGPFSESNLRAVMSASPSTKLPDQFLSKPLSLAFQHGFRLNHARSEYRIKFGHDVKGIIPRLKKLIEPFKNLKSVNMYQEWHRSNLIHGQPCDRMFKAYLKKHLKTTTFDLIAGLTVDDKEIDVDIVPTDMSLFVGPGVAARTMDPLWVPPTYPPRPHSFDTGFPIHQFISALTGTDIRIQSLQLPIDTENPVVKYNLGSADYKKYVHPAALTGRIDPHTAGSDDFLIAIFSSLKRLDLRIDPVIHRGMFPLCRYNSKRICSGIRALHEIEELHLAFRGIFLDDLDGGDNICSESWTLRKAFLAGLVPEENSEGDESDDSGDEDDGLDPVVQPSPQLMQALMDVMGPAGQNNIPGGPANATMPFHLYPVTFSSPKPPPRPNFYGMLPVNPWPKLHTLSLVGLETSLPDACVLFKTIAGTLRSLTLWDFRLLGSCKACHRDHNYRAEHEGRDTCFDYLDLVVALKGILTLDSCVVRLWIGDCYTIVARMGWRVIDKKGNVMNNAEGFNGPHIATIQGINSTTVKTRINTAMEKWLMNDNDTEIEIETGTEMWQLVRLLDTVVETET